MKKILLYFKQTIFIVGFLAFLYYCGFAAYSLFMGDWFCKICCVCLIYLYYRMFKHFADKEDFYPKD